MAAEPYLFPLFKQESSGLLPKNTSFTFQTIAIRNISRRVPLIIR